MRTAPGRQAARRGLGALVLSLAAVGGLVPCAPHASAATGATVAVSAQGRPAGDLPASVAGPQDGLKRLNFGVRLVDVPVDEKNNPRALRYIIDARPAGTVIQRRIMIINDEPRTARFTVYPGAAVITGGRFVGGPGHAGNELTRWITVQHPSVTVGPGQSVLDLVTIRVPLNASHKEHYGAIWTQQSRLSWYGRHAAIRQIARVGIRIYLAVTNGVPPTRFTITALTARRAASGQPMVFAHVKNTGARAVDLTGQLRLTDGPGGRTAGPFSQQQLVTLAPGQAGTVIFALPARLPDGPWTAAVTLVSGLNMTTARTSVVFGVHLAAASWTSEASLMWGGGMLLGGIVIAAVIITRVRRPRRRSLA
ncbi:MAG TPA: hypothetical protein VMG38_06095 [Trebonia sp.]|nr:hypothetical protein [Trebonia sp.]